jgi:hypothetical protein
MSKSSQKGWAVIVRVDGLQGGRERPERWGDLPALVATSIRALAEVPEVEFVEATNGVKVLASFAPRDTEALVAAIQGRYPALAETLRERKDVKLAQELRELLGPAAGT